MEHCYLFRHFLLLCKHTEELVECIESIEKSTCVDERQIVFKFPRDVAVRPFLSLKANFSFEVNFIPVFAKSASSTLLFDSQLNLRASLCVALTSSPGLRPMDRLTAH